VSVARRAGESIARCSVVKCGRECSFLLQQPGHRVDRGEVVLRNAADRREAAAGEDGNGTAEERVDGRACVRIPCEELPAVSTTRALKVGVVSPVMLSVWLAPVSLDATRSGVPGAAGAIA
jgi:hypothetical protein